MNGKQFATATLFAAVLLAVAFTPVASQQTAPYDPWADTNDDGKIDIKDLAYASLRYGMLGNPTKPVTISTYNWTRNYYELIVGPGEEGKLSIITGGYKQITLAFRASSMMPPEFGNVSIATGFLMGLSQNHVYVDRFNATAGWTGPERPILYEYPVVRTYDIRGQMLTVAYYNPNPEAYRLFIEFYMTA